MKLKETFWNYIIPMSATIVLLTTWCSTKTNKVLFPTHKENNQPDKIINNLNDALMQKCEPWKKIKFDLNSTELWNTNLDNDLLAKSYIKRCGWGTVTSKTTNSKTWEPVSSAIYNWWYTWTYKKTR